MSNLAEKFFYAGHADFLTFAFYDFEANGISPEFDQPMQVAATLTDAESRKLERVNLLCRTAPHIIPLPWGLAVRGRRRRASRLVTHCG